MVCIVKTYEKPVLSSPVLIEGLPGIGFVANISALHLIQELKATLFAEVRSSSFQDFAVTAEKGQTSFPINELYYYKGRDSHERDLIILYGNTQALTTFGQYELCGRILDVVEGLGCNDIVTLGGLRVDRKVDVPGLYCAVSDSAMVDEVLGRGAKIIGGQIFGLAGLLVGLGKLRGMKGLCLLAETPGYYPDAKAARAVLDLVCGLLSLRIDLERLDVAAKATRDILESFGVGSTYSVGERKRRESRHWLI